MGNEADDGSLVRFTVKELLATYQSTLLSRLDAVVTQVSRIAETQESFRVEAARTAGAIERMTDKVQDHQQRIALLETKNDRLEEEAVIRRAEAQKRKVLIGSGGALGGLSALVTTGALLLQHLHSAVHH